MANAGPNTNGSQFFIISGSQGTALPPLYSLFGQAVTGLDVLAAIEAAGSPSGKPTARVLIESVTIAEADD
jgi:cyclophilin family peptidyl-prolyl cis-trans isomerase